MARPFPSIRKPSAGWTGAVNYTLEDHIASPYPHPIYPRKDDVLPNDSIIKHMSDAGAHRKYFLSTAELIFTKAEYESNKTRDGATITDPTTRESNLYQYLITAPALAAILADYSASGGFSYENLVKEITGSVGSHKYTMCTEADTPYYAPSIGLFVDLFDKFNAVVGILPSQSKPTVATPTALTSVFALKSHTHAAYESHGASHDEIWAAINAGGGGSGGMGGVIDGTLCTDAATGQSCVTEIELYDGAAPNNQASYTYKVQHNCLLFIQLKNAIIADNESSSVPRDCILVKAGDQVIGTLTDNMQDLWNELDNDGLRIPVKVGTTITLVGDGTTPIFDGTSLTSDSKIVFSEFELTPLSMRVGLPDYNTPTDITDNVCRTDIGVSKNYTAPADGFVLFRCIIGYNVPSLNVRAVGKVAGVDVYDAFYTSGVDASTGSGVVPVRKGDVIDCITSDRSGTTYVDNDGKFEIIFYPLDDAGLEGDGPIEYPVLECAFTNTTDNPFIGTSIPSSEDLTITSAKIESLCDRSNIDLSTCNISLKIDVFTPKMNYGTVVVNGNGFAEIDKTRPVYRNEAIVYCDADNSPAGYYNDYSRHLDVSIVGAAAKIAWSSAFSQDPASDNVRAAFVLPALSTLVEGGSIANRAEWDDFNNSYGNFIKVANDLGLNDCYIRLTAIIDPCTKIINQTVSKAGMFIDGQINFDDHGDVCRTSVTSSDFVDSGSTTEDRYVYTYTTKTDCWLYATAMLSVSSSADYMTILINDVKLSRFSEAPIAGMPAEPVKTFSFAVKKGTHITFRYSVKPTETVIIDIIEFKMSTELTPAKFPSLAIPVPPVDCREESTNASVLPAGSTCEYFTWTESQMRQVFGSAFDFDHARFDVSAVFYVGSSASDYNTAVNKLQDDGILISPTSQGQQVRPSVTIDAVNGERVAKLALPGIDYFCSTVKSDTTDGFKLVTRADGAHISIGSSGNNLVGDFSSNGKKVRMRLLLHVSDRRSEASHMYASTPDWDESKIEVLFDRMTNNIAGSKTIQRDGWILVRHGGATIWNVMINSTTVVGNYCTNSDAPDNMYTIPVSAGDVVSWASVTSYDDVSDGIKFIPAKHTQLEVPDFNIPGSAGVIDGSIWKDASGNELVTNITPNTSDTEITYNVKNDCYLMIALYNTDIGNAGTSDGRECIDIVVNGVVAGCLNESSQTSTSLESVVCGINVAGGSVVKLLHHHNYGANTYKLFAKVASGNANPKCNGLLTFTEFKLRATSDTAQIDDLYTVGSDGALRNRAVNQVTLTGNTTLKLPAAITGKVRDFIVDVVVSTEGTITWQNSDGTSFTTYMYDKARGSNPLTDTLTTGGTYQFYFTERRTGGSFRVEMSELESPT